jgi:transposase InsO family protein
VFSLYLGKKTLPIALNVKKYANATEKSNSLTSNQIAETECVYRNNFTTRKEAEIAIFIWIERWYNKNRIYSALGNKSITDFNNKNQTLAV